ncbi:MAG: 16S rRNA (cytidine(1402)-2'-O)-methyltransferase [Synechococcales cyanobacterium T60_A2020_003]|nr:16S rRNA (cytidine(1402)-2'-O)-methyltransferase [Synechococcales cyanobacterium T60_A2020_003]
MKINAGTLYIVGTPIGNLEDMTVRAVQVLQQVDLIAAEDTRHTGKLLHHFQVTTPQVSYHDHNRTQRLPELMHQLKQGKPIALVSDAGMPGISDPGYELVRGCVEAGIPVVPIPGVTAAITALIASGLPSDRFVFEGFLPAKSKERCDRLEQLSAESRTMVFYEAPHRLLAMLTDIAAVLGGDRSVVCARELTKLHEEFRRCRVKEAIAHYRQHEPQGEFTVVLEGAAESVPILSESALKSELQALINQGLSRSQASRQLAKQTQLSRQQIYQLALSLDADAADPNT